MPLIQITIDPIIAQIGPFQLGWHGLFSMLALVAGVWIGLWHAKLLGIDVDTMVSGLGWVILGAVVGARLFHVLDHIPYYAQHPLEIVAVWQGGIAVYGGFVGGVLTGAVAAWRLGLPVWTCLDAAAPAMLVGQAIGRIGCLINGDAWGGPTGCPCGVVYWHEHALLPAELLGVPTHPYALYEIIGVAALLGLLWAMRTRFDRPGTMFLVTTIGYGAIRFTLSFVRQETVIVFGLQEAQLVALVTAAIAVVIMSARMVRSRAAAPAVR
ncbi:MAG TPA: prolipoprotein diacylglyceryl transferase [Chloroflexota bacterium]|nr:prolipoprotein diacylglyceryl transferase [Chloroflexota bacterium]